ncbi:YDG domain-containing protein [Flavobacterium sp.]|uniref:YDG domain-containing protein n=1 Tax=Flavobacterium sp. TaxID=239 RepID=UPI0040337B37
MMKLLHQKLLKGLFMLVLFLAASVSRGQHSTGFEGNFKSSYTAGDATYDGVTWNMSDALVGNLSNDAKAGSWSVRIRNTGNITMQTNVAGGIGTFTLKYGKYNGDSNTSSFKVEYSTNDGSNWTQMGSAVSDVSNTTLQTFTATLNISGNVRVRVTKTAGGSNRLNIDDVSWTAGTVPASSASDIIRNTAFTEPSNIDYKLYQTTSDITASNSVEVGSFTIRDGAATADTDTNGTTLSAISFTVANNANISRLAIYDGTTERGDIAVSSGTASFTGLSGLTAADGGTKTFTLRAAFRSTVTDNAQLRFTVSAATAATSSSSTFAAANAGGAATSITGDANRIEVTADRLAFVQQPSTANVNAGMTPAVTLSANDANANRDLDFTGASGNVTLTSTGSLTGAPVNVNATNGLATFSGLTHTAAGTGLVITATRTSGSDWSVNSNTFSINKLTQTITFDALAAVTYGDTSFTLSATGGASGEPVTYTSSNTGVATVSGNTVTIVGPGQTTITASQDGNGSYNAATPVDRLLAVNRKQLTITGAVAQNKAYDGTKDAVVTGATLAGGIVGSDDVSIDAFYIAQFDNKNIGTAKPVSALFDITGAQASRYILANVGSVPLSADITAKGLTITGISIADKNFDSTTNATITGTPVLAGGVSGEDVILGGTPIAVFENIGPGGNIPVTVSGYAITGADIANYTLAQPTGLTANINDTGLANQTITFGALSNVTYGDAPFTVTATASSGLAVTFASSDENIATVSGNTVTITGAGTVTITAQQEGNAAYNPAPAVPQELVVNKKVLTVAGAVVEDKIYNGGDVAVITGMLSGTVDGDIVILNGTGQFASADVANGITVETLYGLSGADAGNYELTQPGILTGNILPATLTLSGAAASDKTYNGTTAAVISGTLSGMIAPDVVTFTGTGDFASADAANGIAVASTISLGGADAGNYVLTQPVGLTATITAKALTVTAAAQNKQYDGNTTAQINITAINGVVEGDDVTIAGSGTFANAAVANNKPVTAALTLTGNDAANYTLTQPTGLTANITAMNLTVDVTNAVVADKVYDRTTANAVITGVVITGIAEGEDVQVVSGTFTSSQVSFANNIVTPVLSGTHAGNYTFTQVGTLTGHITPKEATITGMTAANKTYDGTNAAMLSGGSLQGVFSADVVAGVSLTRSGYFAPVSTADQGEDVGTGKAVISTSVLTGAAASNYTLTQPTGITANITAKALTITGVTANGKVYDRTDAATLNYENAQISGIANNDDVSLGGTPSAIFTNYNAGTRPVTVTGFTLAGDTSNYTLTQPAGLTAVITAKTLTMTGGTVTNRTYNATTTAALTGVILTGVETGDSVTANTGTFASLNAGTHNVTVVLGGANAANYTLTQPDPLLTGTINKAPLTVTAINQTKTQGSANPNLAAAGSRTYATFQGTDNATADADFTPPTLTTTAVTNSPAGAYPITFATPGSALNYEFTYVTGYLIINAPTTTVFANGTIWSDPITGSNPSSSNPWTASQTVQADDYIDVSGIGRGPDAVDTAANNRYNMNSWNTTSIDLDAYFTFTITPVEGYKLNLANFVYTGQVSSGSPSYAFRSSLDGFASNIGTASASATISLAGSSYQNLTAPIEFRLYVWGTSSTTATYSVNDFSFSGSVVQSPPAPTAPAITSAATDSSTLGAPDTYQITASGTPVITGYNAVGSNVSGTTNTALPQGTTVNTSTGLVSFDGTTPIGTHYIKVSATSYYGTGTRVVTYTVIPQPSISATPSPINTFHAYQGQGASAAVQLASVTGSNLSPVSGNISLSVSSEFEIALGTVGGYSSAGSFTYSGGNINLTNPQITVRMKAGLAIGTHTGTLTLLGGGATAVINLEGLVEAAPSITTTATSFGPYCVGTQNNVSVAYTTQGTFPTGNYYVQLSNATGVFPTDFTGIISAPSATSPIMATLPNTVTTGSYRVRVLHLSSAPLLTFSLNDNGSDIQVKALPTLTGVQANAVCTGTYPTITLSGLLANTEVNVAYTLGGNAGTATVTANAQGDASFDIAGENGQQLTVTSITRTDGGSCAANFSTNNATTLVVYPTPSLTGVETLPACDGEATDVKLTGLPANAALTVTYRIDAGVQATAQVTADNNGNGVFELTFAPGLYAVEILAVANNTTACSNTALTGMVSQIVVNERPTAAIVPDNSAICLGNTAEIQIALTGTGTLMLTYTDGTATYGPVTINQSEITGGIYTLTVTPSVGVNTYSVTALSNSECAALPAGLTGDATVTATGNTWQGDAAGDTANWFNPENWSCGEVPSDEVAAYITEGVVTITGDQTAYASTVNVSGNGHLIVAAGNNLVVTGAVIVDNQADATTGEITGGQITIENTANLLQASNATNINSGLVSVEKESAPLFRLDYALWASPVTGGSLIDFSPETLANRFYRYNPVNDTYNAVPGATQFEKGTGYLIRIPNNHQDYNAETNFLGQSWAGTFVGTPNNGNVTVNVDNAGFHAVGNPYPSPINIAAFYEANALNLADDAALFFWRKKNGSDYSSYASLTLEGYTSNGQIIENAAGEAIEYGDTSNGYFANPAQSDEWVLNPGQGFIVYSNGNDIVFNNDMRSAENRNQQFRNAQDETAAASRWWVNIRAVGGEFHQAMVSYSTNGTLGIDFARDGKALTDGTVAIYSLAGETRLGIQARPSFDDTDVVPMGYKAVTAGTYSIAVDHVEGVFAQGQVIFLRDNLLGSTHNLTDGDYSFTTEAGTFAGRFDVLYADALDTDKPVLDANSIIAYEQAGDINITSGAIMMNGIKVYDLKGSLLYSNDKVNATETVISGLPSQEQMLIIEVTTEKGKVSKKMIF